MSLQKTGLPIIYTNQVPYEQDVLRSNLGWMAAIAGLAQSLLGNGNSNSTLVGGLACTNTVSPSMNLQIAPGQIYMYGDYLSVDYGVISIDTTQIYKQGLNLETKLLPFVAPGSGTNYYLIQATLAETPTNNVSRPYYNSANPSAPIFNANYDTLVQSVSLTTKLSTISTPSPDAGNVGLYSVTVPTGTTSLNSGNFATYPGAPFITQSFFNTVTYANLQQSVPIYALDTGSANAYAVTTNPVYGSYVAGTRIYMKAANTNTGASTLNISGLGATAIRKDSESGLIALTGEEIQADSIYEFVYQGTYFQILNPTITSSIPAGTMLDFGGTSAPTGFLLCDGTSYLRTDYPDLFTAIGTTWGSVDGTHFNVPNMQRRTAVGSGGSGTGTLGNAVGNTGGEENHTMTLSELVGHTHGTWGSNGNSGTAVPVTSDKFVNSTADAETNSTGATTPFNVIQPSAIVLKIIKY